MQTTLDEIAALPVASNPSNAQVASYVSLLKDFASQVSSATALSPGGVVSSDLGSVTTSLSALVGSPSALGVARGSTQSDPTLATDAYVVTNASNAFTAMWGDLGKSCSGLTSNQSLLAPSK